MRRRRKEGREVLLEKDCCGMGKTMGGERKHSGLILMIARQDNPVWHYPPRLGVNVEVWRTAGSAIAHETCVKPWGQQRGKGQGDACNWWHVGDWTLSGALPAIDVSAMRESHQRRRMTIATTAHDPTYQLSPGQEASLIEAI